LYAKLTRTLGATVPHGMVKVGMDTDSPGNVACLAPSLCHIRSYNFQHAGYDANPSFLVTGFSQMHDDGTGGVRYFPDSLSDPLLI
jgi:putative alpha-1,2-mannosidase